MNLSTTDVQRLACPDCRGPLSWTGRENQGALAHGTLRCEPCGTAWPLEGGLPRLFRKNAIRGNDRVLGLFYDNIPWLHDPVTEHMTFRLLQGMSLAEWRDRYMKRLELASLQPRPDGQPLRILEIGVGTGANLPLIRRELPRGLAVEVWGLDLSPGMMAECRKRLRREPLPGIRLLLGDVHTLPFPDHTFDRVLEVGGTAGFREPPRALREMLRVARPGARLVVVDEQLDPSRPHSLLHRAAFRLLTFYTREARSPRALLPPDVTDVMDEQVSRYCYCLSFRAPVGNAAG
jgi:ubiquinone/menaquinone biosynthesis C-methylase UbiE/uncharacterized protein YbaR (Trm112 family)